MCGLDESVRIIGWTSKFISICERYIYVGQDNVRAPFHTSSVRTPCSTWDHVTWWTKHMYKLLSSFHHLNPMIFILNFNGLIKDQFRSKGVSHSDRCKIHGRVTLRGVRLSDGLGFMIRGSILDVCASSVHNEVSR